VLAVLALAVTSQHYWYALLLVWLAAALTAFVLAGGIPRETTGALRYLILTSLALMLLLLLPAFLSPESIKGDSAVALVMPPGYPQNGERAMEAGLALQTAIVLLIVGFGILLMVVPFHGQLVALATHGAPMVAPFMLLAFPPVVFYLLFRLGQTCPTLFQEPLVFDVWRWMGIAAVAIGGLSVLGQRRWGSLVGYAVLVDWGAGLVALGQGTPDGLEQATLMLGWRALSLLLVGAGWTVVFKLSGKQESLDACAGVLRRRPLSVLALVVGMLSLAAFPLTAGATARWRLIGDLMSTRPGMAWALILAGLGIGVGTAFALRDCLTGSPIEGERDHLRDRPLDAVLDTAFGLFSLWLIGSLFLRSALWFDLVQQLFLSHFSFLPS
jgi:NADH:ubiquinone oxidoreductase subunit 2 (subunit N)